MSQEQDVIHTRIWEELPEPDNPFAAAACFCSGFDVFRDLLGKASWSEYLYLLFMREPPSGEQALMLETLAVAIANAGPRDHSIRAAMNAGVGGSTSASCLMAALAVGAGQSGGAREVFLAMQAWRECGLDASRWQQLLSRPRLTDRADVWPEPEYPAGFDPNGASCTTPVLQTLTCLAERSCGESLKWLHARRCELESVAGLPLAMTGVAAAALVDLGFDSSQGEMLYLLLRLPGAAVHALEQREYGHKRYPLFKDGLELVDDPAHPPPQRRRQGA
jgi:citrate synthase